MGFFSFLNRDMGIDLGTANTLVYIKGKEIIIREPSVVAIEIESKEVLAVGEKAKRMIGRTPGNIVAIRPLKDGVIADFDITQDMLKHFIKLAYKRRSLFQPRIVVCVPSGVTEVEKRAVEEATMHAGAREVYLIEEPMAAAIGAGLPVEEARGSLIVDIGGGTTEVAVISLGGIVASQSIRVGGDELDEAIERYIKKEYNLMIGERTAEEIKMNIGSADKDKEKENMQISGRNLVSGLPKTIEIDSREIYQALKESVGKIIDAIKTALEETPPELASDIIEASIVLTGGGALLDGIDKAISEETAMPVRIAENPLDCVAIGTGLALENIDKLKKSSYGRRK